MQKHQYFLSELDAFSVPPTALTLPVLVTPREYQYVAGDDASFPNHVDSIHELHAGTTNATFQADTIQPAMDADSLEVRAIIGFINFQLKASAGRRRADKIGLWRIAKTDHLRRIMDRPCPVLSPILRLVLYYHQNKQELSELMSMRPSGNEASTVTVQGLCMFYAQDIWRAYQLDDGSSVELLVEAPTVTEEKQRWRALLPAHVAKFRPWAVIPRVEPSASELANYFAGIRRLNSGVISGLRALVDQCFFHTYPAAESACIDLASLKPLLASHIQFDSMIDSEVVADSGHFADVLALAAETLLRLARACNYDEVYVMAVNLLELLICLADDLCRNALFVYVLCCYLLDPSSCRFEILPHCSMIDIANVVINCTRYTYPRLVRGEVRRADTRRFNMGNCYVNCPTLMCQTTGFHHLLGGQRLDSREFRHSRHRVRITLIRGYGVAAKPDSGFVPISVAPGPHSWLAAVVRIYLHTFLYNDDRFRCSTMKTTHSLANYCRAQSRCFTDEEVFHATQHLLHHLSFATSSAAVVIGRDVDLLRYCALLCRVRGLDEDDPYMVAAVVHVSRQPYTILECLRIQHPLPPVYLMYSPPRDIEWTNRGRSWFHVFRLGAAPRQSPEQPAVEGNHKMPGRR